MKHILFTMTFFLFSLFGAKAQNNLSIEEFRQTLAPDTRLIDVRTEAEFTDGHLRGAVNFDWFRNDFTEQIKAAFSKETPLYVYCRSGRRSAAAAEKLTGEGYTVYNMLGGYQAWTKAGMEVTRYEVERFVTSSGKALEITLVKHGSLEYDSYLFLDFVRLLIQIIAADFYRAACLVKNCAQNIDSCAFACTVYSEKGKE